MQYVQLVLTDAQIALLGASVEHAISSEHAITDAPDEVVAPQLAALLYFLDAVAANPTAFPVRTPAMRRSIKKKVAELRGTSQPQGGANKRKRTQERKIGFQKRTRAEKREAAKLFNEARDAALAALALEEAMEQRGNAEALGVILPE